MYPACSPRATICPQLAWGGRMPTPDETERRFSENRGGNAECQGDDDRRETVRQHVLTNDVDPACPSDLCRADVLLLPEREKLPPALTALR